MRCRKASPSKPPDAKARSVFRRGCIFSVLSKGTKYRIKKGAALMSNVEPME